MFHGRDLRNKIFLFEDKIYVIGGPEFLVDVFEPITGKWRKIKSYKKLIKDNLDAWSASLTSFFPK